MTKPRTAAGRAHFTTFVDNQHHDNVDAAYECSDNVDRCDICSQEADDILAIEAEAAKPAPLDADLRFAKALTEYGIHHGNCPLESWNVKGTRCKCGLFALIKEANARLAADDKGSE
jgi:hypothetical protein